jgi:hypothetical protein
MRTNSLPQPHAVMTSSTESLIPRLVGMAQRKLAVPGSQAVRSVTRHTTLRLASKPEREQHAFLPAALAPLCSSRLDVFAVGRDLRGLLPSLLSGEAVAPTIQPDLLKSA